MGNIVREFMTHREPDEHIWVERDDTALIGTVAKGQRPMPHIRPFDLLQSRVATGAANQVLVWEGATLRIAAEQIDGQEVELTRAADFDLFYFQFAGSTRIESELGTVQLEPGEIVLVPAGISHHSTATGESLRLRVMSKESVQFGVDPDQPLTQSKFQVSHSDPLQHSASSGASGDNVVEHTCFWDPESDVWIERSGKKIFNCWKEGGRAFKKIRAFDYFTGITGKGGARAPVLYEGKEFRIDCYNLEGQQRGFHRGLDEDEIWFQFRGHGKNETEWGIVELDAGEMSFVPRGIAHRINGANGFLRMVFYSRQVVKPVAFNSVGGRRTSFAVN